MYDIPKIVAAHTEVKSRRKTPYFCKNSSIFGSSLYLLQIKILSVSVHFFFVYLDQEITDCEETVQTESKTADGGKEKEKGEKKAKCAEFALVYALSA